MKARTEFTNERSEIWEFESKGREENLREDDEKVFLFFLAERSLL